MNTFLVFTHLSNYKNALIVLIDLANFMLKTFANEYKTIYGCEVFASHEENDEYKFPFSLKFCEVCSISFPSDTNLAHHLFMLQCAHKIVLFTKRICFVQTTVNYCCHVAITDLSDRH